MKPDVIFFDLDDTLFPAEAIYQTGLRATWRQLRSQYPMTWVRFNHVYAAARRDVKSRLGMHPAARNRILYLKRLVEILFGHSKPATVLGLMRAYNTCWRRIDAKGVRRLAERMSRHFTLGIVTNQVAGFQLEKMARIDPQGRWFKFLITSEEIGVEKPARSFFLKACRQAGCRPSQAVMVGDSWEGDIVGARRAGLGAIFVHAGPLPKRLPSRVSHVRSLDQLEEALMDTLTQ